MCQLTVALSSDLHIRVPGLLGVSNSIVHSNVLCKYQHWISDSVAIPSHFGINTYGLQPVFGAVSLLPFN